MSFSLPSIRLQVDWPGENSIIDRRTGAPMRLPKASAWKFEIGIFTGLNGSPPSSDGQVALQTSWVAMTLIFQGSSGTNAVSKTTGTFAALTYATWNADTAQHATINVSQTEANIPPGPYKVAVVIDDVVVGTGDVEVFDGYSFNTLDPAGANPGAPISQDAGDLRYTLSAGTLALGGFSSITGTMPAVNLGSGSTITTKFLRGDNTWQTVTGSSDAGALTGATLASNVFNSVLTSVGTLATLTVSGAVTAASFSGSGASLTALNMANASTGTLAVLRGGTGITVFGTGVATGLGNAVNATGGLLTFNAGTLTSGITASSLTSLGTLTSLTTTGAITLSGASGAGFINLNVQSAAPATPSAGTLDLYTGAGGLLQTKNSSASVRTLVNLEDAQTFIGNLTLSGTTAMQAASATTLAATGAQTFSSTAGLTLSGNPLIISGSMSAATWGTSGLRIKGTPGTLTDTSASGTVTTAYTDVLGGNTIAASNARTFTNYYSMYVNAGAAGANVTFTNAWAIGADSLSIGTSNAFQVTSAGAVRVGAAMTLATGSVGSTTSGVVIGSDTSNNFYINGPSGNAGVFVIPGSVSSYTYTFPTGTQSIAGLAGTNTWTNNQTFGSLDSAAIGNITPGIGKFTTLTSTVPLLTSGKAIDVQVNNTFATTGQTGLNVALLGANATTGQTTYGGIIANTHTGTGTNVALQLTASGGSTNTAINVTAGTTALQATTATTLALGGATIGSNALAVTGVVSLTSAIITNGTFYTPATALSFGSNGGTQWQVNVGNLIVSSDNTYDIGASGATRPRSIYVGSNGTFGGNLTASGTLAVTGVTTVTGGILGTVAGGNATAGNLGEYSSLPVASGSAVTMTTSNTVYDITSITLSAGDWDVTGSINYAMVGATVTQKVAGLNSTSATLPTDGTEVSSGSQFSVVTANDGVSMARKRFNVTTSTTIYLSAKATFSLGTVSGYGTINARRVR